MTRIIGCTTVRDGTAERGIRSSDLTRVGTNVSGSFVLGVLLVLLIERLPPIRYARAFAGTGFLGAYVRAGLSLAAP
jgi:fluoride ion exporter CrcB/FEX